MKVSMRTCLWFNGNGEEAVNFYISLLPNSRIDNMLRPNPNEAPVVINFTLSGVPYQALNGGPMFSLNESVSLAVTTYNQEDTDALWEALIADGGVESQCGWLKDRFGLSWQIVPERLTCLLSDTDAEAVGWVMQEMMAMKKINILALEAAYTGENR